MLISPSLLAADFSAIGKEVERVKNADMLHVDIMDGNFVPNISIGPAVVQAIRDKSDLVFDVHLMLNHPLKYIEVFAKAGADIISFHPECDDDTQEVINKILSCGKKAGLAIKPATPAESVIPYGKDLYMTTIMSVEPGFGGQTMMTETLAKAEILHRHFPDMLVEVDGGVNRETLHLCFEAGIDVIVAGTAIFGEEDASVEIEYFRTGGNSGNISE